MAQEIEDKTTSENEQIMDKTKAFDRFQVTHQRTKAILSVSRMGMEGILKIVQDAREELGGMKPGEDPEEIDIDTYEQMHRDVNLFHNEHIILDKYIYSILTVFAWGTLETYLYQVFLELFREKPFMLKTNKINFNAKEILDNMEDPSSLVINKEMNRVGHFKLNDWQKYLDQMLKYKIGKDTFKELKGIYLIRNIVAHNTGIVRPDQRDDIPSELEVINGEIVVTQRFLHKSMETILSTVKPIDEHIIKKYYRPKS
ncbi:hypothetical protein M1E11_18715 [Bacillus sp. JZ8]